jgi:thiamine-monophosphate kinase
MASEFDLIRQYFTKPTRHTSLGVGDDAALLMVENGHELAVSADMLVAGTHFLDDTDPCLLGWKSLAVNISDMAAMGAMPKWATLAIALPSADESWVAAFAKGLFSCADNFGIDLIGGDTTRGPLSISIQIMGQVPSGQAIKRNGARPGDDIWVSGFIGDAALALNHLLNKHSLTEQEYERTLPALLKPQPRVALGISLRGIASSAIDISDGLLADLGHILDASGVGAKLLLDQIPRSETLKRHLHQEGVLDMMLAGGEDYELCFTASPSLRDEIHRIMTVNEITLSRIGTIEHSPGIHLLDHNHDPIRTGELGFDHFRTQ